MLYYALVIVSFIDIQNDGNPLLRVVTLVDEAGPYVNIKKCKKRVHKIEDAAKESYKTETNGYSVAEKACHTRKYWIKNLGIDLWVNSGENI